MYLSHYGLAEPPFAITPDPRYLYMSARHTDASSSTTRIRCAIVTLSLLRPAA